MYIMSLSYYILFAGIACFKFPDTQSVSLKTNDPVKWWSIPQWKYGPIQTPPKPKITWDIRQCTSVCPAIYKPLCAFDHSLNRYNFPNSCELNRYNCIYRQNFQVLHDGECMKPADLRCSSTYNNISQIDPLPTVCCHPKPDPIDCKFDSSVIDHANPLKWEENIEIPKSLHPKCSRFHSFMFGPISQISFPPVAKSKCSQACPHIYKPVCAIDEHLKRYTFANDCVLKAYNCLYDKNLQIICEGACL